MSKLQNGQQNIPEIIPGASPWIWTEDAQPPLGEKVIFADTDDARRNITQIGTTVREDDWGMGTDEPCRCYWMHIPPLPEGGLLSGQESPETRVDIGHEDGHQQLPEDGALANKIAAIMQQWLGTNGGVYAIRGCAMEIAREIQDAAAPNGGAEPLGWIHEDELPAGYPYDEMFPCSKVDVVRMFPVFGPSTAGQKEAP